MATPLVPDAQRDGTALGWISRGIGVADERAVFITAGGVRKVREFCNYYHISPQIRAQVLCEPPRTRYDFLAQCNRRREGGCVGGRTA